MVYDIIQCSGCEAASNGNWRPSVLLNNIFSFYRINLQVSTCSFNYSYQPLLIIQCMLLQCANCDLRTVQQWAPGVWIICEGNSTCLCSTDPFTVLYHIGHFYHVSVEVTIYKIWIELLGRSEGILAKIISQQILLVWEIWVWLIDLRFCLIFRAEVLN